MNFVQIFIVTVPLAIIYIYQFMVLLRNNLGKSTFFSVFEVFITKVILCLFNQLLFLEFYLGLYLCNERKTKIMFFKIILFGGLKNLTKFEYFLHLLCKHDEVMSH